MLGPLAECRFLQFVVDALEVDGWMRIELEGLDGLVSKKIDFTQKEVRV